MPYTKDTVVQLRHQRNLFLAINVLAAACMGILFWLIISQQHHLNHQDEVINQQRYEVQFRDCTDLNRRHNRSVAAIDRIIITTRTDRDILNDARFVRPLIDEILPLHNCKVYAQSRVPNH